MGNRYALIVDIGYYNDASHFIPLSFARVALYERLIDPERIIGHREQRSSEHNQSFWNSHTSGWNRAVWYENYKSAREVLDRPQRM